MPEFEWDEANLEHISRHGIDADEIEEAFSDPRRFTMPAQRGPEPRRALVGATESGRLLFVVYTHRGTRIRVITAREAVTWQRRQYIRRR